MPDRHSAACGVLFATSAYLIWGFSPVYFKAVSEVSALEILAHRVLWSVLLLAGMITASGKWGEIISALKSPRTAVLLCASTLLVSVNWFFFIWAIFDDRVLEASLGYYINPLVSVFLGMLFLGERLKGLKLIAVLLAICGVINQAVLTGGVPWLSLLLAFSFGFYGLVRKKVNIGAAEGLLVETALIAPVALTYLVWLEHWGGGAAFLGAGGWTFDLLLIFSAVMTAGPLLFFNAGARRLTLSSVGLLQFIAPSIHFILAVTVYGEPLGLPYLITFGFIWIALITFSFDGILIHKRQKAALRAHEAAE